MEHSEILDSTSEVHLWALILCTLGGYSGLREKWNHHTLSSGQSMTPLALWYTGMFLQPILELLTHEETDDFGIDYDGPVVREYNEQIIVPHSCNPLTDDGNHGIDHYLFVIEFISVCNYRRSS